MEGTSSVSDLPVCAGDSWQPFCVKISPQISLPWKGGWHSLRLETVGSDVCRRCEKSEENWKELLHKKHILGVFFFYLLNSPAAVSLQFFNNSDPQTGGSHVFFCIYLGVCYRSTLQCNCHTLKSRCSHFSKLLGFYQTNGKKQHSLWSWVTAPAPVPWLNQYMNYFHWKCFSSPISHFVFITPQVCKYAAPPVFPTVSRRLKRNAGRIMENYPVYKKPLKSGGAPLPNDTESNYCMFQHPFHRKGSVSRATHHAYETHLVHITISCRSTVKPGLSLPHLFCLLCVMAVSQ